MLGFFKYSRLSEAEINVTWPYTDHSGNSPYLEINLFIVEIKCEAILTLFISQENQQYKLF